MPDATTVRFKGKVVEVWFDPADSQASNYTEVQLKQPAMEKGAAQLYRQLPLVASAKLNDSAPALE